MKNIYKLHRLIGILTVVPVIFWSCSGLMHPFMSHWFRPTILHETLPFAQVDSIALKKTLTEVLNKNNISAFKNFKINSFGGHTYYMVGNINNEITFFDAGTGEKLENGEQKYAEYVARYMLNDQQSAIKKIIKIKNFDDEYKYINRFLPLWKVSFERADQMDIYVDTWQGKMATFNNTSRKIFIWLFDTFHNWSFIEKISNNTLRVCTMLLMLFIIISSALSGLIVYGWMWKKFEKPAPKNKKGILRKYHRQIGLAVSLVTLTFAGSGAFHVSRKFTADQRHKFNYKPVFYTKELTIGLRKFPFDWERMQNIQLIKMGKKDFYQVILNKTEEKPSEIKYYNGATAMELKDGNIIYSKYLVNKFSNLENVKGDIQSACCDLMADNQNEDFADENIKETKWLTKFDKEYGFVNKRLPVMRLSYDTPAQATFYIDPINSSLAAKIEKTDRIEGLSFAFLHKYFLMEWAGKDVRDIVTMLSALGVLTVSLFGLVLFFKNNSR